MDRLFSQSHFLQALCQMAWWDKRDFRKVPVLHPRLKLQMKFLQTNINIFVEMQFSVQFASTVACIHSSASVNTDTGYVRSELSQVKLCTRSRASSSCSQPSGAGILSCFDKSGLCATVEFWRGVPLWCRLANSFTGLLIILQRLLKNPRCTWHCLTFILWV